jgi:hypothetical protein
MTGGRRVDGATHQSFIYFYICSINEMKNIISMYHVYVCVGVETAAEQTASLPHLPTHHPPRAGACTENGGVKINNCII